ncbi:TetR/AcrR family transcriptional regulator [Planococcus sp. SSTMD024]|uniref:TetR/AcrR family transcriptional regulator n=1 Tax=Planococcus sp. SSTMD024 TaxID=3242163 RepID=UPI00351DFBB7
MSTKKEQLLVAAEQLFYEHGFHAIGLKAIVQEADVALMTLYNHFNSKDELILEVLTRRSQVYMDYLEQAKHQAPGSAAERLAVGHLNWLKQTAANGCMFLRAKEEFASEPGHPIVQLVTSHKEEIRKLFLASGLTATEAIRSSLLFEGAVAQAEISSLDEVEDALMALVQHL